MTRPRVAITLGDPAGIGPEVTVRAIPRIHEELDADVLVVGPRDAFDRARGAAPGSPGTTATADGPTLRFDDIPGALPPLGSASAEGGRLAHAALLRAIELLRNRGVDALVTAPLSKESLVLAGHELTGHTEILEASFDVPRAVLTLCSETLRVAFATNHVRLRDVATQLTRERLRTTIVTAAEGLRRFFGIPDPRIAVCGLNPHAGEGGRLGCEEDEVVRPEIEAAVRSGLRCTGPHPADAVFTARGRRDTDLVIALYHDQGTIPAKMLSGTDGFNVTLGLPVIRTSPDHGTAFDIAGRGVADEGPLVAAARAAVEIARRTRQSNP